MISKELLTAIREDNYTVVDIDYFYEIEDKKIGYSLDNEQWYYINIYELAHKCKEWTIKYSGWTLQSYTNERGSGICRIKVGDGQEINKLIASSEPEAIFRACQWILNKDSK